MLTAAAHKNHRGHFSGIELDVNCVRMAALNLLCRNVDGYVLWGNALSLDAFGGYRLRRSVYGGDIIALSKEQAQELLQEPLKEQKSQYHEQMDLGL